MFTSPLATAAFTAALLLSAPFALSQQQQQQQGGPHSDHVRTCQVGYLPAESKFALLTQPPSGPVTIRRASDSSIALTLTPAPEQLDPDTNDRVRPVDFSALKDPGKYYLDAPGVGRGHPFVIADDAFARPFRLAFRSFLGQRCGATVSLAPDFPQYHYDACHTAPATFHSSSGKTGTTDSPAGWHDAGDYGRYVVNSGITTGTLLWTWELNADKLAKLNLDLPESGGKLPDFLAEIQWNLRWMLSMQDKSDGGVYHKATSANFCGFVMPKEDTSPVLIIGTGSAPYKNTTATADLAAVCAIAARAYRPFDAAFADTCLAAAERAWTWAAANPNVKYTRNPEGINTGGYGDNDPSDELLWAAAELYRTTGKPAYHEHFLTNAAKRTPALSADSAQGWPNVANLAMYTYALMREHPTDAAALKRITTDATNAADALVARAAKNPYRTPMRSTDYYWGSNSVAANYAMMLRLAHRLSPNPAHANAAQDVLHYLLGRNTFNTSFVTHVGAKYAMNPHHRPSAADKLKDPWPGLLVGGPNADNKKSPPARQWFDNQDDYRTNENAINWNAPLVFLLAETLPEPAAK